MRTTRLLGLLAVVVVLSVVPIAWQGWPPKGSPRFPALPGRLLSEAEMRQVLGGSGELITELMCEECEFPVGNVGAHLHISLVRGSVWTAVPICAIQAADGPTVSLALHYDSNRADGSVTRRQTVLGYGWTHNYNIHLVVRAQDVFMPDGTGRLVAFRRRFDGGYTSSAGQTHTLSRVDADTFLLAEVDGTTRTFVRFDPPPWPTSGALYQLNRIADAQGRVTTLSYNASGLLDTITDPYGRQVALAYNPDRRIASITNADGQVTGIEYQGADDDVWRITDPLGYALEYQYDSQNRLTVEKLKDGHTWTCVYSGGKPHQLVDADGQVYATVANDVNWAIDLDHLLQFNEVRYVPGQTTATDGRGNTTVSHYGADGCITQVDHADGSHSTYAYNDDLHLTQKSDEEVCSWAYEYDAHGNRTRSTDPLGNVTSNAYAHPTIPRLLTRRVEPDGDVWTYEYDALGNLTREIDPIVEAPTDRVITYSYAYYPGFPGGRLLTMTRTDRNGHVRRWDYNLDGTRWRETTDPGGLDIVTGYEYDAVGRITRRTVYRGPGATDPVVTAFAYDALGQLVTQVQDPGGLNLTTAYVYDGAGRQVRATNPRGVVTAREHDARGRVTTTIQDAGTSGLNLTTTFAYDGADNRIGVTDPQGHQTYLEYDVRNRLSKTVDAEGYWSLHEYDARGNERVVRRSIDPGGPPYRATAYQYDLLGRRVAETLDPGGLDLTTVFEYAPPGGGGCACGTPGGELVHKVTDPAGKVTYHYYDDLDRETAVVRKVTDVEDNGGDADDAITTYGHDFMFNQTLVTVEGDPGPDLVTSYAYDAADRLTTQIVGPGGSNLITTYAYDGTGRRIRETTPAGNVVTGAYDSAGRLSKEADSIGTTATYSYDENGNTLTQADGLGHTRTYTYDAADRRVSACDPLVEVPQDKCATYAYDNNGNLLRETDNEGLVTTNGHDGLNRRVWMTKDPGGLDITIAYAYDGAGNQTQITDDNGNATTYEYDGADRRIRELYADGTDRLFTYDGVGDVVARTDQMDNVTSNAYDDLHRLTRRSYDEDYAAVLGYVPADVFTYDRAGRMLTADNEHSHVGFTYDDAGRVSRTTQTDRPPSYSYTLGYAYSPLPNTRTLTYPSGTVVVEARDLRDRLTEVWQDGVRTAWYAYDDPGDRVLARHSANGTHAAYEHDVNDRVTAVRHVGPDGRVFAGFAHDYDAVGNRLNARNLQEVLAYAEDKPVTHSETYGHDRTYRLVDYQRGQWAGDDIPAPRRRRTWQIDGVHNWQRFGVYDLDSGESALYCNSINQMNEYDDPSNDGPPPIPDDDGLPDDFMVSPCPPPLPGDLDGDGDVDLADCAALVEAFGGAPAAPPGQRRAADLDGDGDVDLGDFALFQIAFTGPTAPSEPRASGFNQAHDKNGNLVDDDTKEYFYDYDHRPINQAALRAENRLTIVTNKASGDALGEYWYDALGRRIRKLADGVSTVYVLTPDWREIEEYENGALARNYAYGDWIDEILTMDRATADDRLYYHANALASVVAVTDSSGHLLERYVYDAYGGASLCSGPGNLIPGSTIGNCRLFTGRRLDVESALYEYRSRYLGAIPGRFTGRDSIGVWGDARNRGNGYTYVASNPATLLDPTGRGGDDENNCCPQQHRTLRTYGIHHFNLPFEDERGNQIRPRTALKLLEMAYDAMMALGPVQKAMEEARKNALAKCNGLCKRFDCSYMPPSEGAPRGWGEGGGGTWDCRGRLTKEGWDKETGKLPFEYEDAPPELSRGGDPNAQWASTAEKHRYRVKIWGTFQCQCYCHYTPGFWEAWGNWGWR